MRVPEFLSLETLDELPDGSAVVTHGVVWCKVDYQLGGGLVWASVYSLTAPPPYGYPTQQDSRWLSKVAKRVVYDPREDGL